MSTPPIGSGACHNCGAPLHGRFCSACGQKDQPLEPTAGEVLEEVVRELSDLDGRILRSVRRLFLSPGFLTKEYFEGRRVSWVSPVRLYLVFSVSYFAVTSLTGASPLDIDIRFAGANEDDVRQTMQRMGFSSAQEMDRAINEALTTWIPRAMFVLVPLFAWLVSVVRRRSGRRYPHQLIFAFHVFAAFFGVQAIAVAAGHLSGDRIAPVLAVISGAYGLAYTAIALRSVYGGTIRRALAHTLIVLFFYWLATLAVAAAIIVPVVFWT